MRQSDPVCVWSCYTITQCWNSSRLKRLFTFPVCTKQVTITGHTHVHTDKTLLGLPHTDNMAYQIVLYYYNAKMAGSRISH